MPSTNLHLRYVKENLSRGNLKNLFMFSSREILLKSGTNRYSPLFPHRLFIECTSRCNLKCKMCPRRMSSIKVSNSDLPFEVMKSWINQLPYTSIVDLTGLGEPLILNDVFDRISFVKSSGKICTLFSNGTLMSEEKSKKLLLSKLDQLSFSIDSPDPKTYSKIRVGATLENVIGNISKLVKLRDKSKSDLILNVNMVVMKQNLNQMSRMVEICNEMGLDYVNFSDLNYQLNMHIDQNLKKESIRNLERKTIEKAFKTAKDRAAECGIRAFFPRIERGKPHNYFCRQPFRMIVVTLEGNIRPCCGVHNYHVGNAYKEKLMDIWNGKKYVKFRKNLDSDNPPLFCRECHSF